MPIPKDLLNGGLLDEPAIKLAIEQTKLIAGHEKVYSDDVSRVYWANLEGFKAAAAYRPEDASITVENRLNIAMSYLKHGPVGLDYVHAYYEGTKAQPQASAEEVPKKEPSTKPAPVDAADKSDLPPPEKGAKTVRLGNKSTDEFMRKRKVNVEKSAVIELKKRNVIHPGNRLSKSPPGRISEDFVLAMERLDRKEANNEIQKKMLGLGYTYTSSLLAAIRFRKAAKNMHPREMIEELNTNLTWWHALERVRIVKNTKLNFSMAACLTFMHDNISGLTGMPLERFDEIIFGSDFLKKFVDSHRLMPDSPKRAQGTVWGRYKMFFECAGIKVPAGVEKVYGTTFGCK